MPLLKNNVLISDTWIHAGNDDQLPEAGDVIVSFARLLSDFETLAKRPGKLGVVYSNAQRAEALSTFLPRLSVVVLAFPAFNDGRAYSIARQLRDFGQTAQIDCKRCSCLQA